MIYFHHGRLSCLGSGGGNKGEEEREREKIELRIERECKIEK
jgi:hypothetical protein